MEPSLRKLGLPTALKHGVINLTKSYVVCKKGNILTPEQAQVLKLIGECLAEFKITLKCVWSKDGSFEVLHKDCFEDEVDNENKMDED